MPLPQLILWFCFLSVPKGCLGVVEDLVLHESLTAQKLRMGQEEKVYRLVGLEPHKSYEVRVSYPATIPCKISLDVFRAEGSALSSSKLRKLLNVEKVIFDAKGTDGMLASMRAEAAGVRPLAVKEPQEWLLYNIVLEEVIFGIPLDAVPVIVMAVVIIVIAFLYVYVCDLPGLDRAVAWIRGPFPEKDR